jgi:hypothetical protein
MRGSRERACFGRGRGGIRWDPPRCSRQPGSGHSLRSSRLASPSAQLDPSTEILGSPEVPGPGAERPSFDPGTLCARGPDPRVGQSGERGPAGAILPPAEYCQPAYFFPAMATRLEISPMGPLSSFLGAPGAVGGPGRLFPKLGPESLEPTMRDGRYARRVRPRRPEGRRPVHLARAWAVAAGPRGRGEGAG